MELRRMAAMLLALLMLAGMLPALAATSENPCESGHTWPNFWTTTREPTCTSEGSQQRTCRYGDATETQSIPALGHSFGDWSTSRAATCTEAGEEARTCSRCGARETRATGMVDHNWSKWKTTRKSTCDRAGEEERTCAACGNKEKRPIEKKPHTYGEWTIVREPTCSEAGEQIRTCEVCGYVDTQPIATLPHTFGKRSVTLEPTCTQEGEKTRVCQVCGYADVKKIDMTAHPFGDWTVLVEPTCTEGGQQTHACTACGLEETEDMPPRGHRFGEWNVIEEMTDFSIGVYERTCERCGYVEREEREPQPIYRKGDRGDGVKELQEKLNAGGYDCGKADGIFGKKTEAAVKAVEEAHSFQTDGVAWPGVQKWLGGAAGKGPGDDDENDSGGLPDDINSTYGGNNSVTPGIFEDQGVAFSARKFEVVSIPTKHSDYYEGALVHVKLRLTIDNYDSYRVTKTVPGSKYDNLYAADWRNGNVVLQPGESYDLTYGMSLNEDPASWRTRKVTVYLKSETTGIVEHETVEFGPPWAPATVTIIDQETAKHTAGDYMAFLYLDADREDYSAHAYVNNKMTIPIKVDSDGNTEIRNLKLTVEQVNVNHNRVEHSDTFKLRTSMKAGESFDWVGNVKAYPVTNYAETYSIHMKLSGVYTDKYGKGRVVESNMVSLAYWPEKKDGNESILWLSHSLNPSKKVYGPGDRVTISLYVDNCGKTPLKNPTVAFAGASKSASAKWEPINNIPEGTTLIPEETATATWSYTLQQEDIDKGSFEVDFVARADCEDSELPTIAPSVHVTLPCAEELEQEMYLYAKVEDKRSAYLPGAVVPVTLRLNAVHKYEVSRGSMYAVGDNSHPDASGNRGWHDFGHGVNGYVCGTFGSFKKPMYMYLNVVIPEDFKGDTYRAAWVAEADFTDATGGGTYRSNVAMIALPVWELADEDSELDLNVEQRSTCPHEDGVWQPGDKVDVKLSANFKTGKTPYRLTIKGVDDNGHTVANISGEEMKSVSDTVQLTLNDSLNAYGECTYEFRAKAEVKTPGATYYYTPIHTLKFDLNPQDKGEIHVKASVVSENLNPDGKWYDGDKARIRVEGNYEGPVTPRKVAYQATTPTNSESPFKHGENWYSKGIADEFVVQLNAADAVEGVITYNLTAYACEGESTVYTCNDSTSVTFEMGEAGSGPDASGMGADEVPDEAGIEGGLPADPAFTATWTAAEVAEAAKAAASSEGSETPAEAPAETGEGGETPAEAPAETVEGGETPAETPAETGEGGETPAEVPTETVEGGETAEAEQPEMESTEPESSEPATAEPDAIDPETGEPIATEPITAEIESTEPETVEPAPAGPGYEETVTTISGKDYDIPATVCLPKGEGPFPAVVMLHGTGSTRDEAGNGYLYAAPVLAEKFGIATIRIDFPGNGDSTADYMQYNFHSAVADAKAAADYMASLDCIDGDAIGVMGWSQGGTDALLACAWEPETFKSLVTWAGAPDMMLDGFFTEEDYEEAQDDGFFVMEFDWRDSLNVSLEWCDDVAGTDVLAEFSEGYGGPVLAIAGTEDDTVDPRWSEKIVEASGHPQSRTYFIEGMDHTFNVFAEEDLHSLYEAVDATGAFFVETLGE